MLLEKGATGVPDRVRAYAWINAAAGRGDAEAERRKQALQATLSRAEIDQGQSLSLTLMNPR
jgi:hypothetical protein